MSASELSTVPWEVDAAEHPTDASIEERARFLLRYAILAPSSHNSQPWSFAVDGDTVEVYAEDSRWLDVADPDRRELYLSLGCAVENLRIAAAYFGPGTTIEYAEGSDGSDPVDGPVVSVTLDPESRPDEDDTALFEAITDRRTEHGAFEDRPVPGGTLARLRGLVRDPGVGIVLIEEDPRRERLAELQARADERQMDDPAYRRELGHWVGIGALGASWLAARIGQVAITLLDIGEREGEKNSRLVERAPVVAVLTTDEDTVAARVRAGQAFERLMLAATLEGVAVHPMSQILERPELKADLSSLLDLGGQIPQHLFRLGFVDRDGNEGGHTPRWPLSTVLR
jgi:nitroreductase